MIPPTTEVSQLIQRAQRGEAAATTELYRLHAPAIYRYLLMRLNDAPTAEDLTSEVFLQMVESLPRYEERGRPFAAWLYRIAHDRMVDYIRRSTARPTTELTDTLPALDPTLDMTMEARFETQHLQQTVQTLTDEQQLVIQLRFVEGLNLEETAEKLRKSVGAIKAMQHRALQQLARKLGKK